MIDIHVRGSEKTKIEKWWIDKYQNLGKYSVWILFGEQCTTTVRISIEENSSVFDAYTSKLLTVKKMTTTTQTPQGFLELLIKSGQHTYGSKKGTSLTIIDEYAEIN